MILLSLRTRDALGEALAEVEETSSAYPLLGPPPKTKPLTDPLHRRGYAGCWFVGNDSDVRIARVDCLRGMSLLHPTKLSPGVMFAKKNVNPGDALCSEVEGFNLCFAHANENFEQAGIGLLLRERC